MATTYEVTTDELQTFVETFSTEDQTVLEELFKGELSGTGDITTTQVDDIQWEQISTFTPETIDLIVNFFKSQGATTKASAQTDTFIDGSKLTNAKLITYEALTDNVTLDLSANTSVSERVIKGAESNDTILLGDTSSTVNSGAGNDSIVAGSGNDFIETETGNDTINSGTGTDTVDGGTGFDQLIVSSTGDSVQSVLSGQGVLTITTNTKADDSVTVNNVEFVQFSDETVIVNAQNNDELIVAQMYEGLGTKADAATLQQHWDSLAAGATFDTIGESFMASDDAKAAGLDTMSNSDFVDFMYTNIVGRSDAATADKDGFDYWVSQLDNGTMTKGKVISAMADSDEAAQVIGYVNIVDDIV